MTWECARCNAVEGQEGVQINAVCHHCGKPVCYKHRVVIADDAFRGPRSTVKAVHCEECKKIYHPKATPLAA